MGKVKQAQDLQVWYSPFPSDTMNQAPVRFKHPVRKIQFKQSDLLGNPEIAWPSDIPRPVFKMEYTDPLGRLAYDLPDIFNAGRAIVVSENARNLFREFDMGTNEFLEVPLLEQNGEVAIPGRWFALRVLERKSAIDLDHSETCTATWPNAPTGQQPLIYTTGPRDHSSWMFSLSEGQPANHAIALKKSALSGVDLWCDALLKQKVLFVSGRLQQALSSSDLKAKALHFAKTKLIDEELSE